MFFPRETEQSRKPKIPIQDLREMLAIAYDITTMRTDFRSRLEHLLAGIGKLLNASRVSAYQVTFHTRGQRVLPITELRTAANGKLQRTGLVGAAGLDFRLEAMRRAEKVTTSTAIPSWAKGMNLSSLVRPRHTIQSIQLVDDSNVSIAIVLERAARQADFTVREKSIVDTMWHSFRVKRSGITSQSDVG